MIFNILRHLDALEPLLSEHEKAFRDAGYKGEYRRLKFVLYTSIMLTSAYMFKEAAFPLIRHHWWPILAVRCLMIVVPIALLLVQRKTTEPVLNRPLMLAMAAVIVFNQLVTAFERPLDYPFTSHTSMLVLFILYFAFPFRLSTRAAFALTLTLAEGSYIVMYKTYPLGGKFTVLMTYCAFNGIFSYWSASLNTMRRQGFMDLLRIREAKEQSELLYRTLSHDIRTPFAGLLMGSERLVQALDSGDFAGMRTITASLRATLLSTWAMTENLLEWSQLSRHQRVDHPETLLLADIVNETLALFRPLAEHRALDIALSLEDGLAVRTNGRAIRVVARNLLHNACKFSADGGCLRIRTHLDELGYARLRVFNDGAPLSAAIGDEETAAARTGTVDIERSSGARLGLGISFSLAARNGWTLRLSPTRDADGTIGTEAVLSLPGGFIVATQEKTG